MCLREGDTPRKPSPSLPVVSSQSGCCKNRVDSLKVQSRNNYRLVGSENYRQDGIAGHTIAVCGFPGGFESFTLNAEMPPNIAEKTPCLCARCHFFVAKVSASLFKVGVTSLPHEAEPGRKQRKGGSLHLSAPHFSAVVPESPGVAAALCGSCSPPAERFQEGRARRGGVF